MQSIKQSIVGLGPQHWLTRMALRLEATRKGWRLGFRDQKIYMRKATRLMILDEREFVNVPMMFWHSAHYFEVIKPQHLNGLEVWDFSQPGEHRYARNNAAFFTSSMPEEDSVDVYTRHYTPRTGELVWDVGANVGFTTHFLAQLVGPEGRVVAFEPDEENFKILLENIARHGLSNVTPVCKALDARSGTVSFRMDNTMTAGIPEYGHYASKAPLTQVETLSFADAVNAYGMPRYVKMDIEGAELAVIEAAAEMLADTHIEWAIETNHLVGGSFTHERLESVFKHAGYKVQTGLGDGQWHLWASRNKLALGAV